MVVEGTPEVLIASASPYEGHVLELALKKTGWTLLRVEAAEDAVRQLHAGGRRIVLVIDGGLLEMPHDAQWRALRTHHPELPTVVRRLLPRSRRLQGRGSRTFEVPPDDVDGICAAVRSLSG